LSGFWQSTGAPLGLWIGLILISAAAMASTFAAPISVA
jgi:hypothetical protein